MSTTTKEQTGNKKASTPGGKKAANFVIQGSILAIAGIVVRLIGMLYRIPLINIIGKKGNGYYTSCLLYTSPSPIPRASAAF